MAFVARGKFVSYLRVSTDGQGKSGLGLEAQRAAVEGYLNGGRWKLIKEFVEVESGRRSDRPKLAEALAMCRPHRAALVVVGGQAAPKGEDETQFLYRGIAGRNFERRFQLADHVKVSAAKLANGLLTIELQREIPEEKKARAIPIAAEPVQSAISH
jgi:hypothetical protein